MALNPNQQMSSVRLYRIAHGRTGDKGDRSNISVIADRPEFYEAILAQVTVDCVRRVFQHRKPGKISRYELPRIHALNFVLDDVLDGGVNDALNLDSHGKGLAGFLLDVEIMVPAALLVAELA
ncbi:AtuA-related protein [Pollutimonas bauzanensis]|nr:hypothetical protein [Pollutimonas bauzanensis]